MRPRSTQGGWLGLVVLLVALVIVALLGRALLGQMGLLERPAPAAGAPAATGAPAREDAEAASLTPAAALERARAVDQAVQQQARETAERIDKASQ